jgi:hypothetical protein
MRSLQILQIADDYNRRGRAMLTPPDALPLPRVSDGNEKMEKTSKVLRKLFGQRSKVVAFNIPASIDFMVDGESFNTCPQAGACKSVCYARSGRFTLSPAISARIDNLWSTLRPDFVPLIVADIVASKATHVRIHDSGDFYSQSYVDAWIETAKALNGVVFYAYTKSLDLDYSAAPSNLRIVQSEGGKLDAMIDYSRPHSRIVVDVPTGYVNGNSELADVPAIDGTVRIALPYHGARKLTDSQRRYFGRDHV